MIDYIDLNRDELEQKYASFDIFKEKFEISDKILNSLWEAGEKKNIQKDEESIDFITDHAKRHLKAIIARDLWHSSEYYEIINGEDEEILKAIELIKNTEKYNTILKNN